MVDVKSGPSKNESGRKKRSDKIDPPPRRSRSEKQRQPRHPNPHTTESPLVKILIFKRRPEASNPTIMFLALRDNHIDRIRLNNNKIYLFIISCLLLAACCLMLGARRIESAFEKRRERKSFYSALSRIQRRK